MAEATGIGTTFKWDGNVVAQVVTITPPGPTRETIDVEELAPTDDFKRKLVGLIDGGEMSLTINFEPTVGNHALLGALYAGVAKACEIGYKGGRKCSFNGLVTGFAPSEIAAGEVMQAEVTIAVTSKPVWS